MKENLYTYEDMEKFKKDGFKNQIDKDDFNINWNW